MRYKAGKSVLSVATLTAIAAAAPVLAQVGDTARVIPLQPVLVTVERAAWRLNESTVAATRLTASDVVRYPQATLADALRQVPGITFADFSGDDTMPQVMARGFYGGGEAEYVVVLLNGKPLNDVQTGLVRWDAVPLVAVDRIEVIRGGSSALYGDAAIGAVVNVITRDPTTTDTPTWAVAAGSNNAVDASVYAGGNLLGRPVGFFAGLERTDGYREHSERTLARGGLTYTLGAGRTGGAKLTALAQWREYDEPGPLLESDLNADRRASDVFYRFDTTRENSQRLAVEAHRWYGDARLEASLGGDRRSTDAIRTLALAPTFADTKLRDLSSLRGVATLQLTLDDTGLLPGGDRFIIGADAAYGTLESDYYSIITGTRNQYLSSTGAIGSLDSSGSGSRANASAFAEYTLLPVDGVRLSLGVRGDWLEDEYEPDGSDALSASHTAISPKAGINVRWLNTEDQTGHVYVNASRSFKAPTLDQLFDQRRFPVPFPPFSLTTSNAMLEPQYGTQFEAGLYHTLALLSDLALDVSVAGYRMDMKDEIDFDLATLRYVNIARSRHLGLEGSLRLSSRVGSTAYVAAATQRVTARGGDSDGNQLKAVPQHIINAGVSLVPLPFLGTGLSVNHTRGIYLDDANTIEHPPFTRVDARIDLGLPRSMRGGRVFLDIRNLLDATFSTTGYPDPSGGANAPIYYFPAAGRSLRLGVQVGS